METRFTPEPNRPALQPTAQPPDPHQKPQPPGPNSVHFSKTTLKQLGANLPVGISVNGVRVKQFRLRPFRLKEEKELGRMRDEAKGMTLGDFTSGVISKMVQTLGPHNFDTMPEMEKRLLLSQLALADVLYMYLYLRYDAMGPDEHLPVNIGCHACRKTLQITADMGTLEVKTAHESALDLRRKYKLRDGLVIQGKKCDVLWLEPLKWGAASNEAFTVPGAKAALVIQSSIVGADGVDLHPFVITDHELDELTKFDLEGLTRDIEDNSPGPIMAVTTSCPACKTNLIRMIDWSYDSFFSRSSQQNPGKN